MDFNTELNKLVDYFNGTDTNKFKEQYGVLESNFDLDEEKKDLIQKAISEASRKQGEKVDAFIIETRLKLQLAEITEVVSLKYIAMKYFNHSKSWLYQRINGNIVKGKPAKFTDEELKKLQFAINDIGRKLSEFQISSVV
ncbi:DUF5053 domain-containing protein [Bacteroides sp. 51]|uniref:DUF5053 domain-containing protein n=1 Tax=Bacteroides sp. 51 TaxID=2302938 RepID=UPI0013D39E3A|nr:DUF5053 domain-containing protein [Bacteroides sp. 51]NDV83950.1 DUF5053 domain-containing protein [Bacteroides sp. 51]